MCSVFMGVRCWVVVLGFRQRSRVMEESSDLEWLLRKVSIVTSAWKTILLGTLALTVLGFSTFLAWSTTLYSSRMILPINPTVRVMVQTGIVAPGVAVGPLPPTNLYSVSYTDPNPERAKASVERALDQIIAASKPTGSARESIERQIETLQASISKLEAARLRTADDPSEARRAVALANLATASVDAETKLIGLRNTLEGLRQEDILLKPTAAVALSSPNKLSRLAGIVVASLFAMIVFIVFRDEAKNRRHIPLFRSTKD
jgi:hypothetical protein